VNDSGLNAAKYEQARASHSAFAVLDLNGFINNTLGSQAMAPSRIFQVSGMLQVSPPPQSLGSARSLLPVKSSLIRTVPLALLCARAGCQAKAYGEEAKEERSEEVT